MTVDSFRFIDAFSRRVLRAWIARERSGPIPWTALGKPLAEARIAAVTSAAIARRDDAPFDQEGERRDPWWGDPSYRTIPAGATEADVDVHHLHIDPRFAREDLDCVLPLRRLDELARDGVIGAAAPTHYSFMGYLLEPEQFLAQSVPRMIDGMRAESVDAALLVPV